MLTENIVFNHRTPIQIRFNDIDIVGHVNNAMHQHFFDAARLNYFKTIFKQNIDWKSDPFVLVIAKITIEYIKPVLLYDNVFVETKVHAIGNKSIQMTQRVITISDKHTYLNSESTSVLVGLDKFTNKTLVIPEDKKHLLINFEKDILLKINKEIAY